MQLPSDMPKDIGLDPSALDAGAKQLWEFLDELATSDPKAYQEFIQKQMTENAPPGGVDEFLTKMGLADESMLNYVTIEPEPAFVAKTVDGIGKKFFLNVCGHEAVDKPRPLEGSDRVTTDDGDVPPEQLRYPLSLGPPRDTVDKQGRRARCCDVVFHPETVAMAAKDVSARNFIIEVALSSFEQKHKESLCRGAHVKFPNLRYKGKTVEKQRIRKKGVKPGAKPGLREDLAQKVEGKAEIATREVETEPVIEPASSKRSAPATGDGASGSPAGAGGKGASRMRKPEMSMNLRFDTSDGTEPGPPTAMVFEVKMPDVGEKGKFSGKGCHVRATEDRLCVAGGDYRLDTDLPFRAVPDAARSFFVPEKGEMVIVLPCA